MANKIISKRSDPVVFKLRQIRDGKDRSLIFCEGEKPIDDLFQSQWQPSAVYCVPGKVKAAEKLRLTYNKPALPVVVLADSVMEFCSDLTTAPGILALAKPPKHSFSTQPDDKVIPFYLVLHGIQLPQNVGALVRTAEGAGVTKIFTTSATADAFGPKAIRGSTGSVFRLPINRGLIFETLIKELKSQSIRIVAAVQNGDSFYDAVNWRQPIALVMGSEGSGFSAAEIAYFDQTIKIPMQGKVESLNVGSAAAVCLFEAARQRRIR